MYIYTSHVQKMREKEIEEKEIEEKEIYCLLKLKVKIQRRERGKE